MVFFMEVVYILAFEGSLIKNRFSLIQDLNCSLLQIFRLGVGVVFDSHRWLLRFLQL